MQHQSTLEMRSVCLPHFFWAAGTADLQERSEWESDVMDPIYITGAPKTFILKLCIGLITGLVAHKIAKINESTDKKYIFKWSLLASIAGLAFNVIADPIVGYFYKQYILGQPQQMAEVLAKWSAAATFVNAILSTIVVVIIYNALRPALAKSGMLEVGKTKEA